MAVRGQLNTVRKPASKVVDEHARGMTIPTSYAPAREQLAIRANCSQSPHVAVTELARESRTCTVSAKQSDDFEGG